jgi:hypothetical protein
MRALSMDQQGALKDMYNRIRRRTVGDASRASPPPLGQQYIYDDQSGRAVLQAVPSGSVIKQNP